jgi:hypothetical protein
MVRQIKTSSLFLYLNKIEFGKCGEEHGVWAVFKCRKEVKAMHDCLGKWYYQINKSIERRLLF